MVFQGHRPHTEKLKRVASTSRTACLTNQQIEIWRYTPLNSPQKTQLFKEKMKTFPEFLYVSLTQLFHKDLHFSLSAVKRQSKMPHLRIEDVTVIEMNWSQDCHGWTGVTHACNKSQLIVPVAHATPTQSIEGWESTF
jgi:hypothetical protein